MSAAIIEAVPNFSEGQRADVIDRIVTAIQAPGVLLLDVSSDRDHNRTVVTIAGPPGPVLEGLFQAAAIAATAINLYEQRGVHPRLGATDVIPLVPIDHISLAECADLARDLGRRIGEELALPVYLYEAAATSPDRRNLADLRRGQFEGLLATVDTPARRPDFGPARLGPAGAVVVGARGFLVAYNFFLDSGDIEIARRIARRIRAGSGGLPGVKAIGLLVDGRAQVSVNLVDFRQTPLHRLTATVAQAALEAGTEFVEAELIGLMPEEVLLETAAHALKLPGLTARQIVESAIARAGDGRTQQTPPERTLDESGEST